MTVVIAAEGYPAAPQKGGTITGIDTAEEAGARVFQAGTAEQDGKLVASGGRVLSVTAPGDTLKEARDAAYAAVDKIAFPAGVCRDRKSVVQGTQVSVRVDLGGRRYIKKKYVNIK